MDDPKLLAADVILNMLISYRDIQASSTYERIPIYLVALQKQRVSSN